MVALPLNPVCFAERDASPGDQIPPRRHPPTVEGDSGVHGGPIDLPTREGAALPGLMAAGLGPGGLADGKRLTKTATVSYGVDQPILPTVSRLNLHRCDSPLF